MINRYTVIGQPVTHSLSPAIHTLFGEMTQRRILYTRTPAQSETFADIVIDWQQQGGQGCNVTLPFKELALDTCDRLHASARRAHAVNTIHMHRDGARVGHNTDGTGLCTDIQRNHRFPLAGKRILLVGAGGAARGVIGPLLDCRPSLMHIVNRTVARADSLAQAFAGEGPVQASGFDALPALPAFDCIINATSLSLQGDLPPLPPHPFTTGSLSYDMMYAPGDTPFMRWSRHAGARRSVDGFGMLVEQAADAFLIWEGVRPKIRMASSRLHALIDRQPG